MNRTDWTKARRAARHARNYGGTLSEAARIASRTLASDAGAKSMTEFRCKLRKRARSFVAIAAWRAREDGDVAGLAIATEKWAQLN